MALWHMLILVCFSAPVGASLASAQYAKAGFAGYVVSICVGLTVGLSCAWVMWRVHRFVASRVSPRPRDSHQEWLFGAFYFAKVLWIAFAGFLGFSLPSMLLRITF